jgi:hypothetical protein
MATVAARAERQKRQNEKRGWKKGKWWWLKHLMFSLEVFPGSVKSKTL